MSRLEYTYRRIRRERPWLFAFAECLATIMLMFALCLLLADGFIMVN